jgi:hypothetical protein
MRESDGRTRVPFIGHAARRHVIVPEDVIAPIRRSPRRSRNHRTAARIVIGRDFPAKADLDQKILASRYHN